MVECFVEMGQIGQDYGLKQRLMDKSELDHVTQVIGYHPSYLEHFLKIQNFILRGDGPLPYAYRHYLAIMAAARHQCIYLINLHTQEFIDQGGDPNWLKGLDHIPPKLRAIYDINKILAHRPWLLNTEHIERLTKGQHNWSLSEVVHAIVLLSHFHSLSSFVFSCGRTQELDGKAPASSTASPVKIIQHKPGCNCKNRDQPVLVSTASADNQLATPAPAGGSSSAPGAASSAAGIKQEVSVAALMARMITLAEKRYECSETELSNRFKHVEQQAAELPAIVEHSTSTSTTTSSNSPTSATNTTSAASAAVEPVPVPLMISHLVDDAAFTYQDFQRRGNTENIPSTFRIQDYSWDDHGYSLVNRLYNDVGNLLDDKFRAAYNLTYHTMADRTNVDTSKFRRAIWNYIQCMFGIRHDDYDYGEVNQLLERSLKMFIKTACCFPERITKKDYDSILCELQHSEKVHINLMILEARNQAELLYALREIMRYMT